jgi:hypothetical protein
VGERGNAIEALTGTGAGGGNPLDALGSLPLGFIKDSPGMVRDWSEAYLRWREVQEKRAEAATMAAETALGIGAADLVAGVAGAAGAAEPPAGSDAAGADTPAT